MKMEAQHTKTFDMLQKQFLEGSLSINAYIKNKYMSNKKTKL